MSKSDITTTGLAPDSKGAALWDHCYETLKEESNEPGWMTCLRYLHAMEVDENRVLLAVPTENMRTRVYDRFYRLLLAALAEAGIENAEVEIAVREDLPPLADNNIALQTDMTEAFSAAAEQEHRFQDGEASAPAAESSQTQSALSASQNKPASYGDPYAFENFVVGSSNRFAFAAALSVAEDPVSNYNPLFIHSNPGLGKTHLLRAISLFIRTHHKKTRVHYVTTETFLNEFVDGMTNRHKDFKKRYRDVDVLLLDDVQIVEGKEGFQDELFHTFNDLHANNNQIVFSSDRHPHNLSKLPDRLRSRFAGGLTVDIQPPEFETRLAILRHKLATSQRNGAGKKVLDDVLMLVAEKITNNIRELEGALTRITAYSNLTNSTLSCEQAREILGELLADEAKRITPQLIIETTVTQLGYSAKALSSPDRQKPLVRARHTCMYVMRELTDLSYPAIAEHFGSRDHSSVMHGVKKIGDEMHEDKQLFNQVGSLINKIKAT